jgi:hypothetical protein
MSTLWTQTIPPELLSGIISDKTLCDFSAINVISRDCVLSAGRVLETSWPQHCLFHYDVIDAKLTELSQRVYCILTLRRKTPTVFLSQRIEGVVVHEPLTNAQLNMLQMRVLDRLRQRACYQYEHFNVLMPPTASSLNELASKLSSYVCDPCVWWRGAWRLKNHSGEWSWLEKEVTPANHELYKKLRLPHDFTTAMLQRLRREMPFYELPTIRINDLNGTRDATPDEIDHVHAWLFN